ncbi:FG-GAP repeat domain-containing protein, partial [Viscerimonas tarda]
KKLRFRSQSGFYGQVKVTYKITCSNDGTSAQGDAYINVGDKPNFIDDAECTVPSSPFVWDIEKIAQTTTNHRIQVYAEPYVGDVDGDGAIEVVTLNASITYGNNYSDSIFVYDADLTFKYGIPVRPTKTYTTLPLAIGDVDRDGQVEIIYGTGFVNAGNPSNYRLQAYKVDATGSYSMLWESTDSYTDKPLYNGTTTQPSSCISIADIDGDGTVEILCVDKIFVGENGNLLATLPETLSAAPTSPVNKPSGRGMRYAASGVQNDGFLPAIGDIDGDGIQEIVGGNTTYKVTINSRSNPAANTVDIVAYVPYGDGYTSLADIDGDGILDVVVITYNDQNFPVTPARCNMYVWQGSSGSLIGAVEEPEPGPHPSTGVKPARATGGSRAFIGDINGDKKPEICFTSYCMMNAYAYDSTTDSFTSLWTDKTTTDTSSATTMSMFDFDLNGEAELIYRDETHIRILDKDGNNVKDVNGNDAIFNCRSGTHTEYPIVVDTDGDGHAEIIVSGWDPDLAPVNSIVRLMKFGSKTKGTWAPARSVWNQHGYNPLFVNDDLGIPEHPLSPTTVIAHSDGSIHRPFNSFLQQAGNLNTEGENLNLSPDLSFQIGKNQKLFHNDVTDELEITTYLTNAGSMDFTGDIQLSLYLYDVGATSYELKGSQVFTGQTLFRNEYRTYVFSVPNYSSISFPTQYLWYVVINMNDNSPSAPSGAYLSQNECNFWNNMTSRMSYISGQAILCPGETVELNIE